jgi:mRNA-degrading endonuclease YafQ of YafQ-DinJ toxin-antitoxin module
MEKLKIVIEKLLENQELEPKYKDHALTDKKKNQWGFTAIAAIDEQTSHYIKC